MRYPITKFLEGHGQWLYVNAVFNEPPPPKKNRMMLDPANGVAKGEAGCLLLLRRHFGKWPRGPAVSMRSELLVAHEKLGQLPVLTVLSCARVR